MDPARPSRRRRMAAARRTPGNSADISRVASTRTMSSRRLTSGSASGDREPSRLGPYAALLGTTVSRGRRHGRKPSTCSTPGALTIREVDRV